MPLQGLFSASAARRPLAPLQVPWPLSIAAPEAALAQYQVPKQLQVLV